MTQSQLDITLADDCGQDFLLDASFRLNQTVPPKDLTKSLPRGKPIRAFFIASILAKLLGDEFADIYGDILIKSDARGCNFINTLAGSFPGGSQTKDFFDDYFANVQFLHARRGTKHIDNNGVDGGKPPSVRYNTHALPLANLNIFRKTKRSDEPKVASLAELPALATDLEAFQVNHFHDWEPIVPGILKWTREQRPFKACPSQGIAMPSSMTANGSIHFQVELRPVLRKSTNGDLLEFDFEIVVKKD